MKDLSVTQPTIFYSILLRCQGRSFEIKLLGCAHVLAKTGRKGTSSDSWSVTPPVYCVITVNVKTWMGYFSELMASPFHKTISVNFRFWHTVAAMVNATSASVSPMCSLCRLRQQPWYPVLPLQTRIVVIGEQATETDTGKLQPR